VKLAFAHPWALLMLALIPVWWWRVRRARDTAIVFSRASTLASLGTRGAAFLGVLGAGLPRHRHRRPAHRRARGGGG